MKKFGKSAPMMGSDELFHSVSVSRSESNGVTVEEWPGMVSSLFTLVSMIWKSPKASLWMWTQLNSPILLDAFPTKPMKLPLRSAFT